MRKQYNTNNISFDDIANYIFDEVSEAEEQAMEDFLEEDDMYADLTDELLALNQQKGFRSKAELKTYLQEQQQQVLHKFKTKQQAKKEKQSRRYKAIAVLIGLICAIIFAWFYMSHSTLTLTPHEAEEELKKEQTLEQVKMNQASADNWLGSFQLGQFQQALQDLTQDMENATVVVPKSNYFRGVLTLYLYHDEPKEVKAAIEFLEKGQSYNWRRAMYQQIIAYTLVGDYEKARQILSESPWQQADLPASIQGLLPHHLE